jgi:hypothetical protein
LRTDTAAAAPSATSFAFVPQLLDLFSQATELTADRLILLLFVLLVLVPSFSPFVYFVLELIETLSKLVDYFP